MTNAQREKTIGLSNALAIATLALSLAGVLMLFGRELGTIQARLDGLEKSVAALASRLP